MKRSIARRPPAPTPPTERLAGLDLLRGVAMLWMAAFHFSFDLNHLGLMPRQNFFVDPFWTLQRVCIVSLFIASAGIGQGLAGGLRPGTGVGLANGIAGRSSRQFWRRWGQIVACAVLVSLGSWLMFPRSFIFFGVLHGMAVMLLLMRALAPWLQRAVGTRDDVVPAGFDRLSAVWLVLAGLALLAPWLWTHSFFDTRWTTWVGLGTHKPIAEDFAPVLPWFGVFCGGLLLGDRLRTALRQPPSASQSPAWRWFQANPPSVPAALAVLGRWPLSFYMLHQPVLLALLHGWIWLRA